MKGPDQCADGLACSSTNNRQPWRKSGGLEARCVSNIADGGDRRGWKKGKVVLCFISYFGFILFVFSHISEF